MTSIRYKVEKIPLPKLVLGEGPHWDAQSQSLFCTNMVKGEIFRYDVKENKSYIANIDDEPYVSFIIPVAGVTDQFAVGIRRRVGVIQWDGKSLKAKLLRVAFEVEQSEERSDRVLNDGKADPSGRLYAGTMNSVATVRTFDALFGLRPPCSFYKFEANGKIEKLIDNMQLSNGMAWNVKTNKFYLVDSCLFDVKEFDYDPATGDLSNKRILIDFTDNGKRPRFAADGMTIDTDGNLYVATFSGSKILKINPTSGRVELEIKLPTQQVTSLTFGGPNLDVLYVTSANLQLDEPLSDDAGCVFQVTGLGVQGFDGARVRI